MFGARRQHRVPLVYESKNWQHGVFLGATLVVGNHRGRVRQDRRAAPRSHGDARVLRLQHGRLLPALARHRPHGDEAAEGVPRELVPHRRSRQVHLARLPRKPARREVDLRAVRRRRQRQGDADRHRPDAGRNRSDRVDDFERKRWKRSSPSSPATGRKRRRTRPPFSNHSAREFRTRCSRNRSGSRMRWVAQQ